jgi:hypothetical protein
MRVLCWTCYHNRGVRVPATNLDACRDYPGGCQPSCDNCTEAAWVEQQDRDFAAYHGSASWMGSAQRETRR